VKLLLAPHNDDEVLWTAFTVMREKPLVVVVFDSYVQLERGNPVTWQDRRLETSCALEALGHTLEAGLSFLGIHDTAEEPFTDPRIQPSLHARIAHLLSVIGEPEHVWAPAIEQNGHAQHNVIGRVAEYLWPGRVTHYLTYTRDKGKSTSANRVAIESGDWVRRKLRALACYESQIDIERLGCREHFCRDLWEYYE
jgi:LmbE family N-acetylglucosaminyl deacetylase